jgi:hypothetical protein
MFDPKVGQFLSEDPIGLTAANTNTRCYCGDSPTNATDPTGLFEESPLENVHERISAQAAENAFFLMTTPRTGTTAPQILAGQPVPTQFAVGLTAGTEWNDAPEGLRGIAIWLYGKGLLPRDPAKWVAPKTFDTHHGPTTFLHGMTPHDENGVALGWVAEKMQSTIADWIIDQYSLALAALIAARGNDDDPNMKTAGFEIGEALHTIEDLYAPAHVERSTPTGPILRFQDYDEQDPDAHALDDRTSDFTQPYIDEATVQCTKLLEFLHGHTDPAAVRAWLVGPTGPLALAPGASNGGTAKKYARRVLPEVPRIPEEVPWDAGRLTGPVFPGLW